MRKDLFRSSVCQTKLQARGFLLREFKVLSFYIKAEEQSPRRRLLLVFCFVHDLDITPFPNTYGKEFSGRNFSSFSTVQAGSF